MVLILQIYCIYENKGQEESPTFLRKKEGRRTYHVRYRAMVIDCDKASPSFWWDRDRGALWDWDLLFNNTHVLHIRDILFIISNVRDAK
jgi:hypothetical protein